MATNSTNMLALLKKAEQQESTNATPKNSTESFNPEVVPFVDNQLSKALKTFCLRCKVRKSNQDAFLEVKVCVDANELAKYTDFVSKKIINIPVRIDGDLFDLNTLLNLKPDAVGYRIHPKSGEKFLLSQIQPAKDVQDDFDKMIENLVEAIADDLYLSLYRLS